jgi:hypothetical protein
MQPSDICGDQVKMRQASALVAGLTPTKKFTFDAVLLLAQSAKAVQLGPIRFFRMIPRQLAFYFEETRLQFHGVLPPHLQAGTSGQNEPKRKNKRSFHFRSEPMITIGSKQFRFVPEA